MIEVQMPFSTFSCVCPALRYPTGAGLAVRLQYQAGALVLFLSLVNTIFYPPHGVTFRARSILVCLLAWCILSFADNADSFPRKNKCRS